MFQNQRLNKDFKGMSPEDSLAEAIKFILQYATDQGRNGDTQLAHVNPREAAMLERQGGSGTTNPNTGLPEYFDSAAAEGGFGGGGNSGRGGHTSGPPSRGRGPTGRGTPAQSGTTSPGGRGGSDGGRRSGPPSRGKGPTGRGTPARGGVSTNPSSGGGTSAPKADERSFGEKMADGLAAGLGFDRAKAAVSGPISRDDVFGGFQAALGMAPGIGLGMGITDAAHAMGFESEADFSGMDDDFGGGDDGNILSGRPQQPQAAPPVQPNYPWSRPNAAPTAPAGLNFDPAMTPLQQRAAIATGATNADAGIYRDPAIMDFYRNLATYSLTDKKGSPLSGQSPLPVELQFLTQMGAQPGDNTASFLRALAGLNR